MIFKYMRACGRVYANTLSLFLKRQKCCYIALASLKSLGANDSPVLPQPPQQLVLRAHTTTASYATLYKGLEHP